MGGGPHQPELRHPTSPLPLLPSGPDGVHDWSSRRSRCGTPNSRETTARSRAPIASPDYYAASPYGGEGGIRTHEHPLRCYWNSSPAPSTARPPLRSITYVYFLDRFEIDGGVPCARAAHNM